jgi:hypothetical protein
MNTRCPALVEPWEFCLLAQKVPQLQSDDTLGSTKEKQVVDRKIDTASTYLKAR